MNVNKIKDIAIRIRRSYFFCGRVDSRKWLKFSLGTLGLLLLVCALLMLLLDPALRYGHKLTPALYTQDYWMIPGVLRNFDYDTVIIGSSTSQNFNLADFRRNFSCRPVKATASGCTLRSARTFFQLAHRARGQKLKRVFLSLEPFAFVQSPSAVKVEIPDFLMPGNKFNDYKYWWNYDLIHRYIRDMSRIISKEGGNFAIHINPDLMFAEEYLSDTRKFGMKYIRKSYRKAKFRMALVSADNNAAGNIRANIDRNLLPMIEENPDIEFICFLPPYSALTYADMDQNGKLDLFFDLRTRLAQTLLNRTNVKLYDFQWEEFTCDINKYKDLTHYVPAINTLMTDLLTGTRHQVKSLQDMQDNNLKISRNAKRMQPILQQL